MMLVLCRRSSASKQQLVSHDDDDDDNNNNNVTYIAQIGVICSYFVAPVTSSGILDHLQSVQQLTSDTDKQTV